MVNNLPANTGNSGSIPESGIFPGGANCNLLQYSCLGNPMDRGAWRATVYGVIKESDMTEKLITTNNNNQVPVLRLLYLFLSVSRMFDLGWISAGPG